jgi:hypothetical protein
MKKQAIGLAALLLLGTAATTSAQTVSFAEAGAVIARSCGPSIERFCSKVNIGNGQVRQCLQQHQNQVPSACTMDYDRVTASIAKRLQAQQGAFKVCNASIREYCPGVKFGDANVLDCLLTARKVVGASCKQALLDAGWQ